MSTFMTSFLELTIFIASKKYLPLSPHSTTRKVKQLPNPDNQDKMTTLCYFLTADYGF